MSDLARHDVRGPVATLRTERASWDAAKDEWEPASKPTLTRFRPDGQIAEADPGVTYRYNEAGQVLETRFQDGKILCAYDEKGRLIRTVRIDEKGIGTESEIYSATIPAAERPEFNSSQSSKAIRICSTR